MSDFIESILKDMGVINGVQIYLIIDPKTGDELGQIQTTPAGEIENG